MQKPTPPWLAVALAQEGETTARVSARQALIHGKMRSVLMIVKSFARRITCLSGTVPSIMHQWRMALGSITIFVCCAVAVYAYAGPVDGVSPSQLVTGGVAILGIVAVVILAAAGKLEERIDKRVDIRLQADDSALGKHRHDEHAHEALRRSIMSELKEDFAGIRDEMKQLGIRYSNEMDRVVRLTEPIIEQNTEAMRYMRAQARRQTPPEEQQEDRDRRG